MCFVVLCCVVLCGVVWCCVLCGAVLFCVVLCCAVLCCVMLCCVGSQMSSNNYSGICNGCGLPLPRPLVQVILQQPNPQFLEQINSCFSPDDKFIVMDSDGKDRALQALALLDKAGYTCMNPCT